MHDGVHNNNNRFLAGAYQCEMCPVGTYASFNADDCLKCPPGKYQPLTAQVSSAMCLRCQPGTYYPSWGGTDPNCLECDGGRYEDRFGSSGMLHSCPCPFSSWVLRQHTRQAIRTDRRAQCTPRRACTGQEKRQWGVGSEHTLCLLDPEHPVSRDSSEL